MDVCKVGDLVWAKMRGFSPWPGRVANPEKDVGKKPNKKLNCHWIYFFGSNNYGWVEEAKLKPYLTHKEEFMNSNKSSTFKEAITAIEDYIRTNGENFTENNDQDAEFNKLRDSVVNDKDTKQAKAKKRLSEMNDQDAEFNKLKEGGSEKKDKPRVKKEKTTPKRRNSESSSTSSAPSKKARNNSFDEPFKMIRTPSPLPNQMNHTPRKGDVVSNFLDRPTSIIRPDTPPLDVASVSQTLRQKNILPSPLKFGFLGLGIMGSGIVKNLLNSGHSVIVWNRTPERCRDFVRAGAEQGMTPSDVVQAADITFSCVADPKAAKDLVYGNCGVLQEAMSGKGYVEMTGVDAETSQDIAEAIITKGGRYLEAQVQGSKTQAEEGTLVILAAGDRTLFDECQTCFQAMGKNSFYLGEVGSGSKMNLVLQLMAGVMLAGLAEGMALADRAGLQQKDVLEILELTSLACPTILEKGQAIIEGNFPTHLPLQHMQKDLKLSLGMGEQLEQPLPLTASANEVFKHAKRLGYGEHDVSAVYIRARF